MRHHPSLTAVKSVFQSEIALNKIMFARITDRLEVDLGMESLLSRENSEESESLSFFPSLSWQERLGGCLACMVLGYILSLGSFFRMKDLLAGHPTSFVIYTTVGNIISLSGSCFLSGKLMISKIESFLCSIFVGLQSLESCSSDLIHMVYAHLILIIIST